MKCLYLCHWLNLYQRKVSIFFNLKSIFKELRIASNIYFHRNNCTFYRKTNVHFRFGKKSTLRIRTIWQARVDILLTFHIGFATAQWSSSLRRGWQNCSARFRRLSNGYILTYAIRIKARVAIYPYMCAFPFFDFESHYFTQIYFNHFGWPRRFCHPLRTLCTALHCSGQIKQIEIESVRNHEKVILKYI